MCAVLHHRHIVFFNIHTQLTTVKDIKQVQLKLALSCSRRKQVVFGPQFFKGKGISQILDMHFQIALTSEHVAGFA